MRIRTGILAWLVVLSTSLGAQQPAPAGPAPQQAPAYQPIVIYRIDLNPTGSAFSIDEPKLVDDRWVFHSLPDRTLERVPKERIKAITRRSRDFDKEVVWRVEFVPNGRMLLSEEPVKKGTNYLLKPWKGGTLVSIAQVEVKTITRVTGMDAFRAEEEELGVKLLEGEAHFRHDIPDAAPAGPAPGAAAAPGGKPAPGNWTYQGQPGASDAYAPASGTQSRPGDVPKAPESTRPPN